MSLSSYAGARGTARACLLAGAIFALSLRALAVGLVPTSSPVLGYPEGRTEVVDVTVTIVVDEAGQVADARVTARTPADAPEAFDEAALAFCQALTFEPVVVDGVAQRVGTELRLHFEPPAVVGTASGPVAESHRHEPEPEPKPEPEPEPEPARATFTQRVRGSKVPSGASDFHLHLGKLADVPRENAAQMLTLAPGILLTNHGGDGHAPAIFLRGFDAGEGQDLEFRLDGIPLNEVSNAHSHGYADTHFIIPELVDELRVVEGPFDPRQGDFAVAGSAEYHLGLHERGLHTKATLGSYGRRRALVMFGPPEEEDGTFAAVALEQSAGFGVNRASAGVSAMGQYEARLSQRTRLNVLGFSYLSRFDSAGVLRQDAFEARTLPCAGDLDSQFFCSYDPSQGGASSRHGLSARLVRRLSRATLEQQVFVSTRRLHLIENFTGFVNDVPRDGQPQRGDASEKLYDATTFGLRGSLAMRRPVFDRTQQVEVGYTARYDTGDTASRRLRALGGEPYAVDFDNGFGIGNVGVYAMAHLRLTDALSLNGGVRADAFSFSVLDRNRPAVDRAGARLTSEARDAFGLAVQPRLTVQYRLTDSLDWVASFGTGARSSDAAALSDGELAPFAEVRAAETGLLLDRRFEVGEGLSLQGRATAYATRVSRALVFDEVSARNELIGASNRFGALAMGRATYGNWLDAQASSTWAEAHLPPPEAAWWQLSSGERLPYVPRWVNRLDAAVRRKQEVGSQSIEWGAALGVMHVAPRPLPLGKESDSIFTVDTSVRARWRWFETAVSATNLLDARYRLSEFNYASNFGDPSTPPSLRAARHFSAGPPRMLALTITLHFDELFTDDGHDDVHDFEIEVEAPQGEST